MIAGGWKVPENTEIDTVISDKFEKAIGDIDGAKLEPVTLLGVQVVSGTNYCILVKVTPVVPDPMSKWSVYTMFAPLDGDPTILEHKDLDI